MSKKGNKHINKHPVTKMRDGARWIVSEEALAKINQMRKEEKDAKIAAARCGRGNS